MDFSNDLCGDVRAHAGEETILIAGKFVLQCNMFFNFLIDAETKGKVDITKIGTIVQPKNEQKNIREAHENGRTV
jgi:hypothetical protein